jgi:hypothetical protein
MEVTVGTLANFTCTSLGGEVAGTVGLRVNAQAQLQQVNLSACGKEGVLVSSSTGNVVGGITYNWPAANAYRLSVDNSSSPGGANVVLQQGSVFGCHNCQTFGTQDAGAGVPHWLNNGGELWLEASGMYGELSTTATTAYACTINAGCKLHAHHVTFVGPTTPSSPANGIQCSVACANYLENCYLGSIAGSGGTGPYSDVSGSKLVSLGGNTIVGTLTVNAGSGLFLSPTDILTGVTGGITPTCAPTSGWGGSPSCALVAGSTNEKGIIRVTAGTTPGTSGTTTLSFVGTYAGPTGAAPVCTFNYANTGTGAWTSTTGAIIVTASSATAQTFTWGVSTQVAGNTYDVLYTCVAR